MLKKFPLPNSFYKMFLTREFITWKFPTRRFTVCSFTWPSYNNGVLLNFLSGMRPTVKQVVMVVVDCNCVVMDYLLYLIVSNLGYLYNKVCNHYLLSRESIFAVINSKLARLSEITWQRLCNMCHVVPRPLKQLVDWKQDLETLLYMHVCEGEFHLAWLNCLLSVNCNYTI